MSSGGSMKIQFLANKPHQKFGNMMHILPVSAELAERHEILRGVRSGSWVAMVRVCSGGSLADWDVASVDSRKNLVGRFAGSKYAIVVNSFSSPEAVRWRNMSDEEVYRKNPWLADIKERARRKWQGIPIDGAKAARSPWEAMERAARKGPSSTLKSRAKEQFQQKVAEVKTWREKQAEKKAAARVAAEKEMARAVSTVSKNEAGKQAARAYAAQLMAEQKAEHPQARIRRVMKERFKRLCSTCQPKYGPDESFLPTLIGEKCDECKKVTKGFLKPGKLGPVVDRGVDHKPALALPAAPPPRPVEVVAAKDGVCPSCIEKLGISEAPSMVAGSICRFCGARKNPSLVILSNPERVPGEAAARKAWAHFHLAAGRDAKVCSIPDVSGLPKTVVVLGACEGFEWQWNTGDHGGKVFKFRRDMGKGPWLVTDIRAKRLWIVSKSAVDLAKLPTDGHFKAIYYYPPSNSGKHDRVRGYRHEFGEGGRLPEHRWFEVYPKLVWRGSRAIEMVPAGTPFRITERGIVG